MPVRVFRSTDPEAPVLHGDKGSVLWLLKTCLISGYGDDTQGTLKEPPGGWQLTESADGYRGVLKSTAPGAAEVGLFIDDEGADGAAYPEGFGFTRHVDSAGKRAFVHMVKQSFGMTPEGYPDGLVISSRGRFIKKSTASTTSPRYWVLFADERTWYLWNNIDEDATGGTDQDLLDVMSITTNSQGIQCFGDLAPHQPGDTMHAFWNMAYRTSGTYEDQFRTDMAFGALSGVDELGLTKMLAQPFLSDDPTHIGTCCGQLPFMRQDGGGHNSIFEGDNYTFAPPHWFSPVVIEEPFFQSGEGSPASVDYGTVGHRLQRGTLRGVLVASVNDTATIGVTTLPYQDGVREFFRARFYSRSGVAVSSGAADSGCYFDIEGPWEV